jgi:peptidyl-prolyl cis-trans isomerase SurA
VDRHTPRDPVDQPAQGLLQPLFEVGGAEQLAGQLQQLQQAASGAARLSELQEEGLPLFERLRANYTGKELEYQVQHAEREFLDQLILRRLQLQYASQIGINASENEINAALKDVLNRNNMTQEALTDLLTREGLTLQDYKDRLREQIILARLMNQAVRSRV